MRDLPADFGQRLRAARAYANVSQRELAARMDVAGASQSSLRDYEAGRAKPRPLSREALIARFAAETGLPEAFFWGDDELPEPFAVLGAQIDDLGSAVAALRGELADAREETRARYASIDEALQAALRAWVAAGAPIPDATADRWGWLDWLDRSAPRSREVRGRREGSG